MTDADFLLWLKNQSAARVVLAEVVVNVSGVETTRYLSTGGYVTNASDTPASTSYEPIVTQGITFTEQLSLTGGASLSAGDISVYNYSGERDSWLNDIWDGRAVQVFIGDATWSRSDFRMIFNGTVAGLQSKDRGTLNISLRDKLGRLNTPLSTATLGGTTTNKGALIPVLFGEAHNISPLLIDPATLEYQVHDAATQDISEIRDNGIPVSVTVTNSTGKFKLNQASVGAITASVQGDKNGTYTNTISSLVQRIVTGYGNANQRFVSGDLDASNLAAFNTAHPQPVGAYFNSSTNVLNACQMLANSVGAQIVMSRLGKLQLVQLAVPGVGTPVEVGPTQMLEKSLHISERPSVMASSTIGFCKNWTVQEGLITAIPTEHQVLFATEWLQSTKADSAVKTTYKLDNEPDQIDTMLLRRTDADVEAQRRMDLWKVQRTVYSFEGTADLLLTLSLGCAITLTNQRFGLSGGATGTVVSLAPDWMSGRVTVGVLI